MMKWCLILCVLGFANLLWANADYQRLCASCHGQPTEPGVAPSLYGMTLDKAGFMQTLRNGRGPMPEFSSSDISDLAANAVYDYLRVTVANNSSAQASSASATSTRSNRNIRDQLPGINNPQRPLNADILQQDPFAPPVLYSKYCAACHGDLDAAISSVPLQDNPLLINSVHPDLRFMRLKEPEFTRIVLNGHGLMPAFNSRMNSHHTFLLYEWILQQRPTKTPQANCRPQAIQHSFRHWGGQLYSMYCSRCHGAEGRGTAESSGRRAVPAFGQAVLPGQIRYKIDIGHDIAPAHPSLSNSDVFQLANYLSELTNWSQPPQGQTPDVFKAWNGGKCQEEICASLAQAADNKIAQNTDTLATPNAATPECEAWKQKNKRKGPAGPDGLYPACWGEQEVKKFETFCKTYQFGIAKTYPQNRRVQAQVTTAVANTQLRSPWSKESAILICKTGKNLRYNLIDPDERNKMPNWRMRIYAPLVEKKLAKQDFPDGACWWEDPKHNLGAGNPSTGSAADQITLYVRLSDKGRVPKRKFWSGRIGLEDEDKPLSQFSKTERPMYEMLRVYRAQEGQFKLKVYRNLDHDKTRNPKACASCGNSKFTNEPWDADATTNFP